MERPKLKDAKYWENNNIDKSQYYKDVEQYCDFLESKIKGDKSVCCDCQSPIGESVSKNRCRDCHEYHMDK